MGRLISNQKYLYIVSGAGLSPNINGLRFYDSGLTFNGGKSYYSEDNQYAIWRLNPVWIIGSVSAIGTSASGIPSWGRADSSLVGSNYFAAGGASGNPVVSLYIPNNKISIKKQNLGGGKLTAQPTILQLWLRSDAGVIFDGSDVIEWKDQSGHSRNFTKSINRTKAPTFSDGALLFTATSTYSDSNASVLALPSSSLNFTTPYTLITVVRAGANNSCVFSKSKDNSKRRKYQISVNGGFVYSHESKDGNDTSFEYDTETGDDVDIKRLIVSQYSSNTSGLIRYNGNQVVTSSIDVGIDQTNNASVFIGASPFQEGTGYNAEASTEMYVYEILFYNKALSTVEIQQIETYLNNKYLIY